MSLKEKVIFNWSGGKDSALCLYKLLQAGQHDIMCLLTSVNKQYQRISMHGVRVDLLEKQAEMVGLPLQKMEVPEMPTMEAYDNMMRNTLSILKANGATASVFGDIFLEDLRKYREDRLAELGMKGIFPLWKKSTKELVHEFLDLGFKTIIVCVNEKYLDKGFVGRVIDHDFINDLPEGVDPCGENGEFHTFVFDGPIFKAPIAIEKGEIVYRKYEPSKSTNNDSSYDCKTESTDNPYQYGFWYCDLLPAEK